MTMYERYEQALAKYNETQDEKALFEASYLAILLQLEKDMGATSSSQKRVKTNRISTSIILALTIFTTGCYGGSPRARALYASCEMMQKVEARGAMPVLVADQNALRIDLTNIIFSEIVTQSSDSSVGVFVESDLTPCAY